MKILTLVVCLAALTITVYASLVPSPYDNSRAPGLALPDAYERAVTALGTATNRYHCVSANVSRDFSSEGEWNFSFFTTNSNVAPKVVVVKFNGKVLFDSGYR